MLPQLEPAAERWQRVTDYLVGLARAVEPGTWSKPSPYDGWSNKDLLAHLGTGYAVRIAHLERVIESGKLAPPIDVDAANEARVAERRETPVDTIIEEMVAVRGGVLALMDQLQPEHLAVEMEPAASSRSGRIRFEEFLLDMNRHDLEHAEELQWVASRA